MDLKQKLTTSLNEVLQLQQESSYINNIRKSALAVFEEQGFPTKRLEAWKYTSLNSVLKDDYMLKVPPVSISNSEVSEFLLDTDSYRLVFINGKFEASLSQTQEGDIAVVSIQELFSDEQYAGYLEKYFYQIAPKKEPLTALNTAYARNGAFIHVKQGKAIEKPVQILYLSTKLKHPLFTFPRNLVIVEENAQVKIVERHQSVSSQRVFTDSVTEIFTDKNAFIDYYKIQNDSENAILVDNTYTRQKDKSHASVHTFSFGGDITRNNLNFYQEGEYMESTLKGITILDHRQHVDHYTLVNHAEPNCESHQDYKSILSGRSTNAFNGKIMVEKIAQKNQCLSAE